MDAAKIRLSQKEMELVLNADWILTKNRVMEKARMLLEGLQNEMTGHISEQEITLRNVIQRIPPKISKGENYRGLPYLVLDYPRLFEKEDKLAIRTFFWWGHFFSITLHASGLFKTNAARKIHARYPTLRQHDYYYCINSDEWEHHFEADNYTPLRAIESNQLEKLLTEKSFCKLAITVPLQQWDDAPKLLLDHFKLMTGMLAD